MSSSPKEQMLLGMEVMLTGSGIAPVMERAQRAAGVNAPVMITGETGVGKEMVARAIHHYSLRCSKPWIDVNCGALPDHLVESELFGYEKGAFSGAEAMKPGFFELANGGTLFLDEVAELDARMQVKLLRVLDGVPYYRLGGVRKVAVDVRVVAATSRDLEAEVEAGTFRRDLYYRLAAIRIDVPALRERSEDVLPLAQFFLERAHAEIKLSPEAASDLSVYEWPGNVRELRNVITYAAVFTKDGVIKTSDLPEHIQKKKAFAVSAGVAAAPNLNGPLEEVEKHAIFSTLSQTEGHREKTARILGISRRTLSRKLKAYGDGKSAS